MSMTNSARSFVLAATFLVATALSFAAAAGSRQEDRPPGHQHEGHGDVLHERDYRQVPRSVLLWGELAKVQVVRSQGRYVATYLPSVLALEGKTVTLLGFMAPVHGPGSHAQFLLSDRRFLCGGCDSAPPPESIVEVNALSAVPAHERPVLMRGKLQLVRGNANGLVYRLNEAQVVRRLK